MEIQVSDYTRLYDVATRHEKGPDQVKALVAAGMKGDEVYNGIYVLSHFSMDWTLDVKHMPLFPNWFLIDPQLFLGHTFIYHRFEMQALIHAGLDVSKFQSHLPIRLNNLGVEAIKTLMDHGVVFPYLGDAFNTYQINAHQRRHHFRQVCATMMLSNVFSRDLQRFLTELIWAKQYNHEC